MMKKHLLLAIIFGVLLFFILIIVVFFFVFGGYAFFLPNPPKPDIMYGEFNFELEYEIDGNKQLLSDTYICEFDGYKIDEGRGKTRKWKGYFKNEQHHELYSYRIEDSKYKYNIGKEPLFEQIVLKNVEHYKIVFSVSPPEYFLNDPNYKTASQMPYIQVYDIETGYYMDFIQSKKILDVHKFKIINWYCDPPIKNTFN